MHVMEFDYEPCRSVFPFNCQTAMLEELSILMSSNCLLI